MVARLTVTADTNIYVSALHFGGKPRQLVEAARSGLLDLAISDPTLDEIARVLSDKFGKHLLRLGAFEGVRIVPVAEFVERFAPAPPDTRVPP